MGRTPPFSESQKMKSLNGWSGEFQLICQPKFSITHLLLLEVFYVLDSKYL